jgi:hypothetical protein
MQLYTKILIGMAVGVLLGFLLGPNSFVLGHDGVTLSPGVAVVEDAADGAKPSAWSSGVRDARILERQSGDPEWLHIEWSIGTVDLLRFEKDRHKVKGEEASTLPPLPKKGSTHQGWIKNESPSVTTYSQLGQTCVDYTEWLGRLFLALIKMVVVPLVFFSLTVGVGVGPSAPSS